MDRIINFAIVGCGRISHRHAEHIAKIAKLTAVCDTDIVKARELADKYGVNYYTDIEELLSKEKQTDVISICTPNGLHAIQTIKSLQAGFHVLCEKPMAINVHDCGAMIQEAEKANRRLFIVKQNRFNPPISALKDAIREDRLGQIFSVQLNCFWNRNNMYYTESHWKGTLALDGGILYTQFSHFIDLLFWLIGDIKDVHAYADNFIHNSVIEFEDAGAVVVRFYSGAIGTINFTINAHNKNMEGSLTVFGEKGTVKIGGQYLNVVEYQNIEGYEIGELEAGNPPNFYGQYVGSMSNHDIVYQNLVDVLNNHGIIATNGFEGLKTIEIIDKIYSSIKKNNL